jgi:type IV fimbrial biogenesis protein FimT
MNFMEDMNARFSPMNGRRTSRGFTLIELLVTIAIIAIMVSIGVPMYGQFTRGSAISGATTELVAAINEARSRAVSERHSVRLEQLDKGDTDGNWLNGWQLVRVSNSEVLQVVDRHGRGKNITVDEASDLPSMVFDKEGRPGKAISFAICYPGDAGGTGRTVAVTAFGRVSVTDLICP